MLGFRSHVCLGRPNHGTSEVIEVEQVDGSPFLSSGQGDD